MLTPVSSQIHFPNAIDCLLDQSILQECSSTSLSIPSWQYLRDFSEKTERTHKQKTIMINIIILNRSLLKAKTKWINIGTLTYDLLTWCSYTPAWPKLLVMWAFIPNHASVLPISHVKRALIFYYHMHINIVLSNLLSYPVFYHVFCHVFCSVFCHDLSFSVSFCPCCFLSYHCSNLIYSFISLPCINYCSKPPPPILHSSIFKKLPAPAEAIAQFLCHSYMNPSLLLLSNTDFS